MMDSLVPRPACNIEITGCGLGTRLMMDGERIERNKEGREESERVCACACVCVCVCVCVHVCVSVK